MASAGLHTELLKAYLWSEINRLVEAKRWTNRQFAKAVGKSPNSTKEWLEGNRLPDKGNLAFICAKAGADPDRSAFMDMVWDQLFSGSEFIADLDQRALYIVESVERNYGGFVKWDPSLLLGVLQTEATFMNLIAKKRDPASRMKLWKQRELRAEAFFARFTDEDGPGAELYVPASAIADLDVLTAADKARQIEHLRWVDSLPGCEVLVVPPRHLAVYPFDMFLGEGRPATGPDFVYVENRDQSRHIVQPEKIALYDQDRRHLRAIAQGIGRFLDGGLHRLAEEHPEQRLRERQLR
ncbi:Scr1 family TA system antitoxin-like transcriptional regulator [Glycomyces sp. NRRL B-16210]|uniref:Scr1 family TA system antitoxin-like transcriptional regulator n=1 Tax=Glycomyces sp. NRRL B-16210 TaxID=1463821 RepID=UPI0004C1BF68|nr:Scr1 family TA system antitoxin-like transcriptional regulator [Glycomyces sp. NRRL B-16210]